ncbi:hypothetical protein N7526_003336 [Penicillium atrosanguineum]|nr:hypothetical protein N7526_003336 [Penicillium atrosanguineum]
MLCRPLSNLALTKAHSRFSGPGACGAGTGLDARSNKPRDRKLTLAQIQGATRPEKGDMSFPSSDLKVEDQGLTLLYSPSEEACSQTSPTPTVHIIFIHGLGGDPRKTWEYKTRIEREDAEQIITGLDAAPTKKRTGSWLPWSRGTSKLLSSKSQAKLTATTFWPADSLPSVVPEAKIWAYGYNANVLGGFRQTNKNNIRQHGGDLMVQVERDLDSDNLPVIFVAHSLGGLLLKEAMHQMNISHKHEYHSFLNRIKSVVFCGTPHSGSGAVNWPILARNMLILMDSNNNLLEQLKSESESLDGIQENFTKILYQHHDIKIHSFVEGRAITGIVEDHSSKLSVPQEVIETIDADHREMVKERGVKQISKVLRRFVQGSMQSERTSERTSELQKPTSTGHHSQISDAVKKREDVVAKNLTLPKDHPKRLNAEIALAHAYQYGDRIPEAIKLFEHVLAQRKALPDDHFDRLASEYDLGGAYMMNNLMLEAVELLYEAVNKEMTLPEDHPDRQIAEKALHVARRYNDQISTAATLLAKISVQQETHPEDHPDRLASENRLAEIYRYRNQVPKAMNLFKHILSRRDKINADHPILVGAEHGLAIAYRYNDQIPEAIEILEGLVERQKTLPENDHRRRASRCALAVAYVHNNQIAEADKLLEEGGC